MPKRANLNLQILFNDEIVWNDTREIKILPPNQFLWNQKVEILRCFVNPNDSAVTEIIVEAKKYLKTLYNGERSAFSGYQVRDLDLVKLQVESIYQALKESFKISYTNCPPTFFQTNTSQTILLPREILEAKSGNCLDLSILFSSCIERIGLDPVIFLLSKHAFPGFFSIEGAFREGNWKNGISRDFSQIKYLLDSGLITTFETTMIETDGFKNAIKAIDKDTLKQDTFQLMINLRLLRESKNDSYTPLAFNEIHNIKTTTADDK
jgi:hypothetical protein